MHNPLRLSRLERLEERTLLAIVYNNFGPGHDGWDYNWGLGWSVAGPNVAAQYGVQQALSFTATTSGQLSDIWMGMTYAPLDTGYDEVTVRLARRLGSLSPRVEDVLEQWVITGFGSWSQWSAPHHLIGSGESQLVEGESYWLWAEGGPTTWCAWSHNLDPTLTAPHTLRREDGDWLPAMQETASAFRVDVTPGIPDPHGSIAGRLWNDADRDGVPDSNPAETPLAGWTVYLDSDGSGSLDPNEPHQATDAAGNYIFAGLDPGMYLVTEVLPSGWEQIYPGSDDQLRHPVDLEAREAVTGIDFGNHAQHVEIHGSKWNDLDGDGVRDGDEPLLEGWTFYLDLNTNGQRDATEPASTTDAQGNYSFTDLEPGEYTVAEVSQSGWTQTYPALPAPASGGASSDIPDAITAAENEKPAQEDSEFVPGFNPISHSGPFAPPVVQQSGVMAVMAGEDLDSPSAFDLRDGGYVTPVRNQGNCGSCWAFATYGSLESSILKEGGPTRDFSENHVKNTHGFDWLPCAGGNDTMSRAYLSRWSGPVDEADDPYHDWDDRPSPGGPPQYYVRESLTFDDDSEMKEALMTRGALYMQFYWNPAHYRSVDATYYYSGTEAPNHAVTIVGWDDAKVTSAATPGAWLTKNSWGTGWGEEGYFWLSYADTVGGNFGISFCDIVAAETFKTVHYYDEFGGVTEFSSPYALNAFTADPNEALRAVQFWTQADGAGYDLRIYREFSGGVLSNLVAELSGTEAYAGYHTVDLPSLVSLAGGDSFYVYLGITNGGSYPQACDRLQAGYTSACTAEPGQSYYSSNGTTWTDLTTWDATANFSIKALTVDYSVPGAHRLDLVPGQIITGIDFGNHEGGFPPIDIGLSSSTIDEDRPAGTLVGVFSTIDPEAGDFATYSLVAGIGSTDNLLFTVDPANGELCTAVSLDFETQAAVTIRVRSTDQNGLWCEKAFAISVANINEAPTAEAGGPYLVGIGNEFHVTAAGSADPDASSGDRIALYEWDFDGDGAYEMQTDNPLRVEPPAETGRLGEGVHMVGLRVTDTHGLVGTDTATLHIRGGRVLGTDGNDTIRITAVLGDPGKADVFINTPGTSPTYSVVLSYISAWNVSSGEGDDALSVDFSIGDPLPAGGLEYDGGTHANGDTFRIQGTHEDDAVIASGKRLNFTSGEIVHSMLANDVELFGFDLGEGEDNLFVSGTALRTGHDEAISDNTALTIQSGGSLDLGGTETVHSVTLRRGDILNGTLVADSYAVESGTISANLAGTGSLMKTSAGTVTLSGSNTYTGGTLIGMGTLVALPGSTNMLPNTGEIKVVGGTLDLGGNTEAIGSLTVISGSVVHGTVQGTGFEIQSGTITAGLSGPGDLKKTGTSTVTLTVPNSYQGGTTVSDGILEIAGSAALPETTTLVIHGGTVVLNTPSNQAVKVSGLRLTGLVRPGTDRIPAAGASAPPATTPMSIAAAYDTAAAVQPTAALPQTSLMRMPKETPALATTELKNDVPVALVDAALASLSLPTVVPLPSGGGGRVVPPRASAPSVAASPTVQRVLSVPKAPPLWAAAVAGARQTPSPRPVVIHTKVVPGSPAVHKPPFKAEPILSAGNDAGWLAWAWKLRRAAAQAAKAVINRVAGPGR